MAQLPPLQPEHFEPPPPPMADGGRSARERPLTLVAKVDILRLTFSESQASHSTCSSSERTSSSNSSPQSRQRYSYMGMAHTSGARSLATQPAGSSA